MTQALLFVCGVVAGAAINAAIHSLSWTPRPQNPWSRSHIYDEHGQWLDRLPVWGWFRLRRKSPFYGRLFWLRPLLIELGCGLLLVGLHDWEVSRRALVETLPDWGAPANPLAAFQLTEDALWGMFIVHAILLALMLVATFIDIDEQTIPDSVTIPGTILGLSIAALFPWTLLPGIWVAQPQGLLEFLTPVTPNAWPQRLAAAPNAASLGIALACYWGWCVALLPRRWRGRRGAKRAIQLILARLGRDRTTPMVAIMAFAGAIAIAAVWRAGDAHWVGLVSSLVGMAAGGGMIWGVRLLAGWSLQKEAMGFGDVTLMAMIGSFLGWQPCLMIFFLAPLAGLVVGGAQLLLRGENTIPYGPFLCTATAVVVVWWPAFWDWGIPLFALGWLLPAVFAICLFAMGAMLFAWRLIASLIFRD